MVVDSRPFLELLSLDIADGQSSLRLARSLDESRLAFLINMVEGRPHLMETSEGSEHELSIISENTHAVVRLHLTLGVDPLALQEV